MSDLWPMPSETPETVLFVCEHGVAKSLMAKLLFERYARAAGLAVRAEARATAPDEVLPPWVLEGLGAIDLDAGAFTPRPLEGDDVQGASRVVSFDLPEVATAARSCAVTGEQWDSLPLASQDFVASHAAIERRVRELVERLVAERSR
jgi:arsenate reductase